MHIRNDVISTDSFKKKLIALEKNVYSCLRSTISSMATKKHLLNLFISTLVEAGFILGSVYASSQFIDDEKSAEHSPFIVPSLLLLTNFLLRTPNVTKKHIKDLLVIVRGSIFSLMNTIARTPLFHEGGHALTALSLFKHPKPHISLHADWYGFDGGATHFKSNKGLTQLGGLLGHENSLTITTVAGVGESMVENYLALIIAQCVPNEFPEVKTSLRLMALTNLIGHLYYALTTYMGCHKSDGHDFCQLDEVGFPPYAAIILMCGSMLILQAILSATPRCYQYIKNKCNPRDIEDINIDDDEYHPININDNSNNRIVVIEDNDTENAMRLV